jgi:hypothetical protein
MNCHCRRHAQPHAAPLGSGGLVDNLNPRPRAGEGGLRNASRVRVRRGRQAFYFERLYLRAGPSGIEWNSDWTLHPLTLARLAASDPSPPRGRGMARTTAQHLKKCAAASSRGAGASLVTQKEKGGSRPLSRNTAGTGRTPPGRTARSYLHHVARLAGARSGAVASSAVSQGLTKTNIWPRFPDAACARANVGFVPTADVLKAGPQATSGQAVLFARETRSTLSVRPKTQAHLSDLSWNALSQNESETRNQKRPPGKSWAHFASE